MTQAPGSKMAATSPLHRSRRPPVRSTPRGAERARRRLRPHRLGSLTAPRSPDVPPDRLLVLLDPSSVAIGTRPVTVQDLNRLQERSC